jgi:hypothetical protein
MDKRMLQEIKSWENAEKNAVGFKEFFASLQQHREQFGSSEKSDQSRRLKSDRKRRKSI